jgi:tRNA-Thr(GGU) m(6)t(6)A37 methyltransferase TsaA
MRSAKRNRRTVKETSNRLEPIGFIRSALKRRKNAPRQGREGAPDAWLAISRRFASALPGINVGEEIIVLTWFHEARRDVLKVHTRGNKHAPLTGVFATRSPDRPNPIGLHRLTVQKIVGNRYRIGPIEAIDGTPVVDIKPVLQRLDDS